MKRSSNDSKASQTEVLVASVDNQVPEQNIPKNVINNGMSSQRVQYYQCPCCKCGNSHYQQLVSGSIPGSCFPASVAYEVPQKLSTIEENDTQSRKSYDQNENEYYRNINHAAYGEPQKRNGLDEDEDDPNCICPRDQTPPRQVSPLPPLYQQQQQQQEQQRTPCSCRTCDCCVSCGRTIRPYRDNGTATGPITSRAATPKICLPKCPGACNPNRLMVDEEVMVVPTYETKEVTANTMKEKPCRGSARGSQQSRQGSEQFDRYRPRNDYRSNCERCCGRYDDRYDDRYDGRYNDRRDNFCGDKYCRGARDDRFGDRYSDQNGGRNEGKNQHYNEFDEVCYCDPTCDPRNPACGTCTDIVAQEEKEILPYKKESQNTMTNQDSHVRSHTCHSDPVCSLCDMDQFSEKSRPVVVDKSMNTMPVKKKCSLFKSKK